MFKWEKIGRLFNPTDVKDRDWLEEFAQAPSVLIFEDYIRVYFSCRPRADLSGQYVSYSAYVDLDPNDLTRILRISDEPILQLGSLGTFDEFGTYPVSVIRHGTQTRVYYGGWTRCESVPFNVAIGVGIGDCDGKVFEKVGPGPILSYTLDEPYVISGPKIRFFNDKWYLFYISGKAWILDNGKPEPVYKIRMAISDDGFTWKKQNRDLIIDKLGINEAQASPDVIFYDGMYHMFFCYRHGTDYRSKEYGYRIGYAYSHDLLNWTRDDDQAGIEVSDGDGWDSQMVSYPHVFNLNGDLLMLYLGNHVGKFGFGVAKLKSYKKPQHQK